MKQIPTVPLKQLLDELSLYDKSMEVSFSGLTFKTTKPQSNKVIQVQFEETVYRNFQGDLVFENHKEEKS